MDRANPSRNRWLWPFRAFWYLLIFCSASSDDPKNSKPGDVYTISEHELASRLSYFLWSSMPDEELLGLADKGELRKNLDAQVKRMLTDPRSKALAVNFAGQWLEWRNLKAHTADRATFPSFDDRLKAAMVREARTVLRGGHPRGPQRPDLP